VQALADHDEVMLLKQVEDISDGIRMRTAKELDILIDGSRSQTAGEQGQRQGHLPE
jgi:hypothetical protein